MRGYRGEDKGNAKGRSFGLIKILVVTNSFPQGIPNLVNGLAKRHELHVVYLSTPERAKRAKRLSERCFLHAVTGIFSSVPNDEPLTEYKGWRLFALFPLFVRMLIEIRRVVSVYDIDIVHAHWAIPSGFLACLVCRKTPVITTLRGSDVNLFGKRRLFQQLVRYALRHSTKMVALANDLREVAIALGADGGKIEVIPSGIDTSLFKPIDKKATRTILGMKNCFQIIFAGNLISLKRVDMLIRVCSRLFRYYPHIYLTIVGEGPEHAKLEQLARDGDFENVQFTGRIAYDKIPLYIGASDVLVLPSKSEGLPDCVQEAMACGVPVIATNVGGLPELIEDGINGYLVNSEDELQTYLDKLINYPEFTVSMGENALEFAKRNLRLDAVVEQTEKLYNSVLKRQ